MQNVYRERRSILFCRNGLEQVLLDIFFQEAGKRMVLELLQGEELIVFQAFRRMQQGNGEKQCMQGLVCKLVPVSHR